MASFNGLLLIMVAVMYFLGLASLITGIFILVFKAAGKDFGSLAGQTARVAQKGMAEDMAGLVSNASDLLDTINQLMKTTAGIGIFLCVLGVFLIGGASWMAFQLASASL